MSRTRPGHGRAVACIASVAVLAACCAVPNSFTYDDAQVGVQTDFVRDWAHLSALVTRDYFSRSGELSYRPVTTFSYFVDYAIWGGGPWGYHLTNLGLHVLAALGLYGLLIEAQFGRRLAFWAGLTFGVFPTHAESICAIGFREEALVGALAAGSVGSALRFMRTQRAAAWLAASMILAAGAMFAKETGVVAPALACIAACHLRPLPSRGKVAAAAAGLGACLCVYACVRFGLLVQASEGTQRAQWSVGTSGPAAAVRTVATYLRLMAWPQGFAVVYGVPDVMGMAAALAVLAAAGAACAAASLPWRGRLHPLSAGLLWCGIALGPASNLVPTGCIVANRLAYLPAAGLCIALGAGLARRRAAWAGLLTVAFATGLAGRCFEWRDDLTLWRAAARRNPDSALARVNSAVSYDMAGRDRYAAKLYERFLDRMPEHGKARFNLARILHDRGERDRAEAEYRRALGVDPTMVDAAFNLGKLYREVKRPALAVPVLEAALRQAPWSPHLHHALGLSLRDLGETEKALAQFTKAVALSPNYWLAHYNRGRALATEGRPEKARSAFAEALRFNPRFQPAKDALANLP